MGISTGLSVSIPFTTGWKYPMSEMLRSVHNTRLWMYVQKANNTSLKFLPCFADPTENVTER
jgi:hypothetical protein